MKKIIVVFSTVLLLLAIASYLLFASNTLFHAKESVPYKIAILSASDSRLIKVDGIVEGLQQYGLYEDDYEIILANADGDTDLIPSLATDLVASNPDIIVTLGTFETSSAKDATLGTDIPVIFVGVGCASEMGIIEDGISTGCNITGIDSHYVQLSGKRLEYMQRLVPTIDKVLVLYNPVSTPFGPSSVYLFEAAEKLNIELDIVPVVTENELLSTLDNNGNITDGIMLLCSLLFETSTSQIVDFALNRKIPVMGINEQQVEDGALASYGITRYQEGVQAARLVANILQGQDPELIPVEAPVVLEFHVNANTAKLIGVELDLLNLPHINKLVGDELR